MTPFPILNVMPAQAGTHDTHLMHHGGFVRQFCGFAPFRRLNFSNVSWVPASAGMTGGEAVGCLMEFAKRSRSNRRDEEHDHEQ